MSGSLFYHGGAASPTLGPTPRAYSGQMCGVHVPGLPPVDGGAADPTLVLSWFYDRYPPSDRARIRRAWAFRDYRDVLLSWPDARAAGASPEAFVAICQELVAAGFLPCVMLSSKVYDPRDDATGTYNNIAPVLPLLLAADCVARYCVGWELNLFNSATSLQQLIDGLAGHIGPHHRPLYVHFSGGVFAWQPDGHDTATFWNANVGKLTGILHQHNLDEPQSEYQSRLIDCLVRFAGQYGFAPDSGFGHPWDCIELEITASWQFNDQLTEAAGDAWGDQALATPGVAGPLGLVRIMGSGNGHT